MVNKRNIIIGMFALILIATVIAAPILSSNLEMDKEDVDILKQKQISDISVGECIPTDKDYCTVKIKDVGLNKEIENIKFRECVEYNNILIQQAEENVTNGNSEWEDYNDYDFCLTYENITETELNTLIDSKIDELLIKVIEVQKMRNNASMSTGLTEERTIEIKETAIK